MGLTCGWTRYGEGGRYSAYAARPDRAQAPLPAVIVIQEIWGVDAHIEDVTRRVAQAGYAAFAPDLYALNGARTAPLLPPRLDAVKSFLNTQPPSIWTDAAAREAALAALPRELAAGIAESWSALFPGALAQEQYLPALLAAAAHPRAEAPTAGANVAAMGFCLGGGLAGLLACSDPELAGAVIFYGSAPQAEKIPAIRCPVLALHGALDARLVDALPAFKAEMVRHGKALETVVYDGAPHAFFNDTRPSYRVGAARDAFARLLVFLRDRLA